jgi:Spy/CpxP family protein refolding chaperone
MNWKRLKAISAAGALSMAMLATGVAQNTPAGGAAQAPATTTEPNAPAAAEAHGKHMRMLEQLNLTDQQKTEIHAIHAKAKTRIQAVKSNSSLTDAQKRARIRRIRQFSRGRIFQVLTVDQRQQLRAEIRQHHQQMQKQKGQPGQNQPNG